MKPKFKIAILGMGGVGGYIGGKLAAHFTGSEEVEIIFIARGENEKVIRTNGLKLITPQNEQTAHPASVTSDPGKLGNLNLIVCCVKSYDLETSLELIRPCVNNQTIILPFLNGVDAAERIQKKFPQAQVWEGCIYIVSRLTAPGVVKETGNVNKLFFGAANRKKDELLKVESLFKSAGMNVHLSENISQTMWEKFLFISPLATLTSYLDLCMGDILISEEYSAMMIQLLTEIKQVADGAGVKFPDNTVEKMFERMKSLSYTTTSSMHDDFKKGNRTELDSLTGYVVNLGRQLKISVPLYEKMLDGLQEKLSQRKP